MALLGTRAGDFVTVRAGANLMAAVKLGDHDYVRLERAPEEAAQESQRRQNSAIAFVSHQPATFFRDAGPQG
jgi:hypothetical protein